MNIEYIPITNKPDRIGQMKERKVLSPLRYHLHAILGAQRDEGLLLYLKALL